MFQLEEWRAAPGYEGLYEVSNLGRVRSIFRRNSKHREFLKGIARADGYRQVALYNAAGEPTTFLVHRLVLLTFRGEPGELQGAHLNGDKSDNRLANLIWATALTNSQHRVEHGTDGAGERNSQAQLTAADVAAIRAEHRHRSPTHGCTALAKKYGTTFQNIWSIVTRKNWKTTA